MPPELRRMEGVYGPAQSSEDFDDWAADMWLLCVESPWVGNDASGRAHRTHWAMTALHYSMMSNYARTLETSA